MSLEQNKYVTPTQIILKFSYQITLKIAMLMPSTTQELSKLKWDLQLGQGEGS